VVVLGDRGVRDERADEAEHAGGGAPQGPGPASRGASCAGRASTAGWAGLLEVGWVADGGGVHGKASSFRDRCDRNEDDDAASTAAVRPWCPVKHWCGYHHRESHGGALSVRWPVAVCSVVFRHDTTR